MAPGPRPRRRSSFARTALMLKNVAGGRFNARSEPRMKSAEASATAVSSVANVGDVAQTLVQTTSPAKDANERSGRNLRRGIMSDVPFLGASADVSAPIRVPPVIGTESAAFAAYAKLKWLKGSGNVGKAVNRRFAELLKIKHRAYCRK